MIGDRNKKQNTYHTVDAIKLHDETKWKQFKRIKPKK